MMPEWFLAAMARAESLSLDSAHDRARLWFLLSDELRRHGGAPLDDLEDLGRRFLGVDLQFRRCTGGQGPSDTWPHPWRARLLTSKNERANYRLTAYGPNAGAAIASLAEAVAVEDGDRPGLARTP